VQIGAVDTEVVGGALVETVDFCGQATHRREDLVSQCSSS
jgi:hypothetical protein